MSSILRVPEPLTGEQQSEAGKVKTIGAIALVVAIVGIFVPFAGLLIEAVAFLLARWAMSISRNNGLDLQNERLANIARTIAGVFFVLWVIGTLLILLR